MSTTNPKVTAVVASYNYAKHLPRRIESLLHQTHQNLEILIIDDHSKDESLEVIQRYRDNSKVNILALDENQGWVNVSNLGIEKSDSEYILFANCDDFCEPDLITLLVTELESNRSAGLAFSSSFLIDEFDNLIGIDVNQRTRRFKKAVRRSNLLDKETLQILLLESCIMPNLSCVLFRKEVFEKIGTLSQKYDICADWDIFIRISKEFSAVYVPLPRNYFRQHPQTIRASQRRLKVSLEMFEILSMELNNGHIESFEKIILKLKLCYSISAELLTPLKGFKLSDFFDLQKKIQNWDYRILILLTFVFFGLRISLVHIKQKMVWKSRRSQPIIFENKQ